MWHILPLHQQNIPPYVSLFFHIKSKSVHVIAYLELQESFIVYPWSVAACPPRTYGNQHYGENRGHKCNCGRGEECHALHGCISIPTGEQGLGCACKWLKGKLQSCLNYKAIYNI